MLRGLRISRLRGRAGAALEDRVRLLAPARRLRFELTRELLERHTAGRRAVILDAGCGDCALTEELARRHPEWTIVAADRRTALLEQARSRIAGAGSLANVDIVETDLTENLGAGVYDAVAAVECLEEIPDDTVALARMAAALRPGGVLVAHVPERDWRPVLRSSDPIWRDEVRHGYTAGELAQLVTAARLDVVSIDPTCRGTVRLAQEIRDRIKTRHVLVRAAFFPLMTLAVRAERVGATWGPPRALIALAQRRPCDYGD